MAAGAVVGAAAGAQVSAPATAMAPFWAASNWYFESNNEEIAAGSFQLTTTNKPFKINLNSNGWMKDYRCIVRSAGGVGGTPSPDGPWNIFQNTAFQTTTGSQFFKNHSGFEYFLYQAYGRPWEGDPSQWFDFARSINPAFTFKLAPEITYTAGALPNMDDRRQYNIQGQIATISQAISGSVTTAPTLTFASGIDTWAQVDARNVVTGVTNQAVPGGVALQTQRQLSVLPLNGAGSVNTIDARSITGIPSRLLMIEVRDNNGVRQDYLTDPITFTLDTRTLANYTQADLFGQFQDHYGTTNVLARPTGIYVFPRFFRPDALRGQGWLYTQGGSRLQWQSSTLSTATNLPGTITILAEQVVPTAGTDHEYLNL